MNKSSSTALGVITVLMTLAGWASIPLFLRHFAELVDFWTSNGWRYGFSAVVWMPVLIVAAMRKRLPPGLWKAAIVPSIVNAAGQVCFTAAHYRIEPALLTFGLRTQLIFVAIGAWMLFPAERAVIRRPGYLIGAALLILGMTAVIVMDESVAPISTTEASEAVAAEIQPQMLDTGAQWGTAAAHATGVTLAIGSGLLFACYGLSVRKYMHGVNSVLAFAAICQYTAAIMIVLMLALGDAGGAAVLDMPADQFSYLLLSALIGIAFGHMFYYMAIARLGVAVAAGILQLQPFLVAIGSMTLFGEVLTNWQWAGGSVAVIGAMLMLGVQWRVGRRAQSVEQLVDR